MTSEAMQNFGENDPGLETAGAKALRWREPVNWAGEGWGVPESRGEVCGAHSGCDGSCLRQHRELESGVAWLLFQGVILALGIEGAWRSEGGGEEAVASEEPGSEASAHSVPSWVWS